LTDFVGLSVSDALAGIVGARHLHGVGIARASVAAIRGRDGLSWLDALVVEGALAWVLGACDLSVLLANASVASHVESLTKRKVLSVVDAFADLVLRDDFAVLASVLLALVRRIPDGARHSDGAESLGSVANRRRRRLALLRNVTLDLLADFASTAAAVVLRGEGLSDAVGAAIVSALVVRLALFGVAVDSVNSVYDSAGTIAVGRLDVGEPASGLVRGAAILAHATLRLGVNIRG